jgi:hypothetical protein
MISLHRLTPGLALCGLLAACAGEPAAPPAPPPKPQLTPDQVDGIFRGTSTRFQADTRACPSPGLVVLRVVDGQFQYRWNGRISVDGSITPEGDVQGGLGEITLSGKLVEGRIEGPVSNATCAYHFRAVKRER